MKRYVEIALGVKSRGRAVEIHEVPKIQEHAQKNNLELYRSYYFFDYTLVEHLQTYKTVKGFRGSPIIDAITLDVDKKNDTDSYVHERAVAMLHKLEEMGIGYASITSAR